MTNVDDEKLEEVGGGKSSSPDYYDSPDDVKYKYNVGEYKEFRITFFGTNRGLITERGPMKDDCNKWSPAYKVKFDDWYMKDGWYLEWYVDE